MRKNVLFLINKEENAYQIYEDGKFIDEGYIYSRDSKNIIEAVKKEIYFEYKQQKIYNTKILFYGHNFTEPEDFPDKDIWNWYFNIARSIKYHFFTSLKVKHGSGYWYQFLLPRVIIDNKEMKLIRWLNFYFNKKNKKEVIVMRWFVTGDTHGELNRIYNWIEKMDFNSEDINVIIAGDMGICWRQDAKDLRYAIDFHEQKYCFHLWFIDGNHENFDILKTFEPNTKGIVNMSSHIHYLSRGTVLNIQTENGEKNILCMGGADSVDRFRRVKHISWWEDEKITKEDIAKVDKKQHYDYVITHAAPQSIVNQYKWKLCILLIAEDLIDHSSEQRLEELFNGLDYDKHYFGHYHADVNLDDKHICLLNDFIEL